MNARERATLQASNPDLPLSTPPEYPGDVDELDALLPRDDEQATEGIPTLPDTAGGNSLPEEDSEAVVASFLGLGDSLPGLTLRPPTLATMLILERSGNSFAKPGAVISELEEPLMEACRFLAIADARRTAAEAQTLARDPEALDAEAITLADRYTLDDVAPIMSKVVGYIKQAAAAQVRPDKSRNRGGATTPGKG